MTESHKSPLLSADPRATLVVFSAELNGSPPGPLLGLGGAKPCGEAIEVVVRGKVLVLREEPVAPVGGVRARP